MRIYISNLPQYNQRRLIGQWLELPCTTEDIQNALSKVLCLDEEYFITDSEDIPFEVNDSDNPYEINKKAKAYHALGGPEMLCVGFLLSEGYDWSYSLENHLDVVMYAGERLEDVACSLVEEGCFGAIPEGISNYIDHEAIARDLEVDGYVEKAEGVFYYAG